MHNHYTLQLSARLEITWTNSEVVDMSRCFTAATCKDINFCPSRTLLFPWLNTWTVPYLCPKRKWMQQPNLLAWSLAWHRRNTLLNLCHPITVYMFPTKVLLHKADGKGEEKGWISLKGENNSRWGAVLTIAQRGASFRVWALAGAGAAGGVGRRMGRLWPSMAWRAWGGCWAAQAEVFLSICWHRIEAPRNSKLKTLVPTDS